MAWRSGSMRRQVFADPSSVKVFGFIVRNSNGCHLDIPLVDWASTGIYVADSTFYNTITGARVGT